ncbi:MAG TPA: NADH-quinone oxidoreductase subunit NuoE [Nitrospirota bacterium]|nr:NADH-quinone oxidoreductase subunit NuoE [Nitrospirota bacterium]
MLTDEKIRELTERVRGLPHPEEALVDLMHEAQEACGYLSDEAVDAVARIAGVNPARVDQLATFYNLIFRRPVGRKVILVCDSISCWVMGMEDVFEHLKRRLGVELGGTTDDGAFTLLPIVCLGACHVAPAMMVGKTLYGNLTPERIDGILEKERV